MAKTGAGLAQWAKDIHAGGQHVYWYGTYCNPCTKSLYNGKKGQYPSHYKDSRKAIFEKHIEQGKTCTDCAGLIKGYYWEKDGKVAYRRDGLPDKGSNGMYNAATVKGKISDGMPDIPGLLLWTKDRGHVAVYIGGGEEVEARSFSDGIQRHAVKNRSFYYWGLCPYVTYTDQEEEAARAAMGKKTTSTTENTLQGGQNEAQEAQNNRGGVSMPTIRKGDKGTAVKVLQRMLMAAGCKLPRYGADGSCGEETVDAVKAFQTTHNLTVDGICGPLTWAALAAG